MAKPSIEFNSEEKRDDARRILAEAVRVICNTCSEEFIAGAHDGKAPICGRCGMWAQKMCRKRRRENKALRDEVRDLKLKQEPVVEQTAIGPESSIDDLMNRSEHQPGVSVRTANAIFRFNEEFKDPDRWWGLPKLITVGDLLRWSRRDMLEIKHMGPRSVDYIEKILANEGFALKKSK